MPGIIAPSLRNQGEQNLELLNKFQSRTIYSITTDANLHIFKSEMIKLASLVYSLFSSLHTLLLTKLMSTASVFDPCSIDCCPDARPLSPTYSNDETFSCGSLSLAARHQAFQCQALWSNRRLGTGRSLGNRHTHWLRNSLPHRSHHGRRGMAGCSALFFGLKLDTNEQREKRNLEAGRVGEIWEHLSAVEWCIDPSPSTASAGSGDSSNRDDSSPRLRFECFPIQ